MLYSVSFLLQVTLTLEQLAKVEAPYPEEQQRCMIQLSKLSERMRVEAKGGKSASDSAASKELHEVLSKVLHGCVTLLILQCSKL